MSLFTFRSVFLGYTVVTVAMRVLLVLGNIENYTGFDKNPMLGLAYYLWLLAGSVAWIVLGSKVKAGNVPGEGAAQGQRQISSERLSGKGIVAVGLILAAAGTLYYVVMQILNVTKLQKTYVMLNGQILSQTDSTEMLVQIVGMTLLPILGIVFYLLSLGKENRFRGIRLAGVLGLMVWQTIVLLKTFLDMTAQRHVSNQMLSICTIAMSLVFITVLGRLSLNMDVKRGQIQLWRYGTIFAVVGMSTCAGLLAGMAKGMELRAMEMQQIPLYLAMALCAFLIVMAYPGEEGVPAEEAALSENNDSVEEQSATPSPENPEPIFFPSEKPSSDDIEDETP